MHIYMHASVMLKTMKTSFTDFKTLNRMIRICTGFRRTL